MTIHAYKLIDWTIHADSNELTRDGESAKLESRVMQLLVYFCDNPRRVISHEELTQAVWGRTELSANSLSVAVAAIRQALDDDVRKPRYIETHKKLGYRLIVTPKKLEATLAPAGRRKQLAAGIAAVLIVAIVATWGWFNTASRSDQGLLVITVDPITNGAGSSEYDDVAETLGDVLIAELARHGGVSVRKSVPESLVWALSVEPPRKAGDTVLSGRLIRDAGQLVLTLHLEDTETARVLWADRTDINRNRLLTGVVSATKSMLASLSIDHLESTLGGSDHDDAETLYELARQLASVTSDVTIKLAHGLLLEALAIDPEHGPAHALLAEMYSWHYPTSFWGLQGDRFVLAEEQLELAERFGADEAYIMVTEAGIFLARDRQYDNARTLLERAASLRPDDPWVLRPQIWANMLLGDFEVALEYNEKAAAASLDPRSVYLERTVPLYYVGRFDEALELHTATVGLGLKPLVQGPLAAIMSGNQVAGFKYWVHFIRHQGVEIEDESEPLRWIESGEIASAYDWLRTRSGKFLLDWNFSLASASWRVAAGHHDLAVEEISAAIRVYRTEQEPLGNPSYSWTLFLYDPLFAEVRRDPRLTAALDLLRAGSQSDSVTGSSE
jgi:DNA-binding winged helix-turn-helix (wHTH) protein/tetratricopeptide (TPR) repeat protein/TolB-like protein